MLFTKLIAWPQLSRTISNNKIKNTTIASNKKHQMVQKPYNDKNQIMETSFNEHIYSYCCGNGCVHCIRIDISKK